MALSTAVDRAGAAVSPARRRWGERRFVLYMLVPAFFFLVCFYVYPTLYNLENSFTGLSLFGRKKGG